MLAARRIVALFGALYVAGATPIALAAGDDPAAEARAAVADTVEKLSSILKDAGASPDARRAAVKEALAPSLDMPFITRSALGRDATVFSRDQRAEFAREMERYVIATWLQRVARANLREFEIRGASWDAASQVAVVHTRGGRRIATRPRRSGRAGSEVARVDYRLHERDGVWRIRTLVIEGVDVLELFRDQFAAALRDGDADAFLERLREVNERLEARNPFAAVDGRPDRTRLAIESGAVIRHTVGRDEAPPSSIRG